MSGTPLEIERKVVVEVTDAAALGAAATSVSRITQTYLVNAEGLAERVRRRERRDASGTTVQLTHTSKRAVSAGVVEEDEREIDDDLYATLLERADPERVPIDKTRYVVPWHAQVLEIDDFVSPPGLWLLEIELASVDALSAPLDLPDWVHVVAEVTGDPAYANWNLALRPR